MPPRITFVTPLVTQGGIATVRASVTAPNTQGGTSCGLAIAPPGGPVLRLPLRRALGLTRLEWLVRIPPDAAPGRWSLVVACTGLGRARAVLQVGRKLVPAQVVVTKSGFTQMALSTGNAITYGLVLANTSPDEDALGVDVRVSFADTQGRSVASDSTTITGTPAGGTFYLSGEVFPNVSLTVASLQPTVSVRASKPKRLVLPPVSGTQLSATGGFFNELTVTGNLTNPYAKPMPESATIYAVVFDGQGNVLGGGSEQTLAQVQPGATVSFQLSSLRLFLVPADRAASVQVSVDPCSAFEPATCPAPGAR